MRYELNFDEDKIIDIEAIGDDSVLDLKDCCKIMNGQKSTIQSLKKENEQLQKENGKLRQSVEYWQKKYEQGTETFQISENDTTFQFNSNQAQLYIIKNVSPNGVVRLGNGHKAEWRMKDVREINQELPPFEDFNRETFMQLRNRFYKFDKDVLGRIIYNIYIETFGEYI